jgi:hypothetical protein
MESFKSHKLFGPADASYMDIEIHRLIRVFESIKKNGYNRSNKKDGDIECHVLVNEQDFVYMVNVGTHRMAAVSALNYSKIPVEVTQIIRREDVNCWPHVKDGLFSITEALYVFDRIFNGTIENLEKLSQ